MHIHRKRVEGRLAGIGAHDGLCTGTDVQGGGFIKKLISFILVMMCGLCITACGTEDNETLDSSRGQSQEESGSSQESSSSQESGSSQESSSSRESVPASKSSDEESTGEESGVSSEENGEIEEITPAAAQFLEKMCLFLPEFQDAASLDEQFWHDFIFFSYTARSADEGMETVWVMRDDLGFEEQEIKISKEDVKVYVKLVLGIEMPDYEPLYEEMREGQTACYYQDGYYYIGVSDFPDYEFTYQDVSVNEDNKIIAKVAASFEDQENVGAVYFELEPADNENGFVIMKKIWDIHFD